MHKGVGRCLGGSGKLMQMGTAFHCEWEFLGRGNGGKDWALVAEAADAKAGAMEQGGMLKGRKPRAQDYFGLLIELERKTKMGSIIFQGWKDRCNVWQDWVLKMRFFFLNMWYGCICTVILVTFYKTIWFLFFVVCNTVRSDFLWEIIREGMSLPAIELSVKTNFPQN